MTSLKKIRTQFGVSEYRLANGLRLLYKRVSAAGVVAVCVTYHVGSRNEAIGHTGSTHILEHLLFKDSKNFNEANGKPMKHYLEWFGAQSNATTWLDRTNYFELLPSLRLKEALALEADRMRGSLFSDADLSTEMTVVRNEYERGRNDPFELLDEAMMARAYTTHPYRIPTIGAKEDIEATTTAKLREFYDTFYHPNNATLAVFGDVPFTVVQALAINYFGPVPPAPHAIPRMSVVEPEQKKPRSVSLKKPLGISIASLMYKIPRGRDPEYPAALLLTMVLAFGFSSRMQHSLIDTGLVSKLFTSAPALHDRGVATFTAHCAHGVLPEKVLAVMRREIVRCARTGVSQEEVARGREILLSQCAFARDGVLSEVRAVSEAIAAGDWTLGYRLEREISTLKPHDITRAAKKYFTRGQETSGMLLNKSVSS